MICVESSLLVSLAALSPNAADAAEVGLTSTVPSKLARSVPLLSVTTRYTSSAKPAVTGLTPAASVASDWLTIRLAGWPVLALVAITSNSLAERVERSIDSVKLILNASVSALVSWSAALPLLSTRVMLEIRASWLSNT